MPALLQPSVRSPALWADAVKGWQASLDPRDMKAINSTTTLASLEKSISSQKKQYRDETIPKLLDRLDPFFNRLKAFTSAFDTIAQVHMIGCLTWGSLKIVIEVSIDILTYQHFQRSVYLLVCLQLASRFRESLESVVCMYESLEKHLPRFEIYLSAFPAYARLEQAVFELYHEVVGFSLQAIRFFRKHPIRKWISLVTRTHVC